MLTIGQLAKLCEVTVRTIRHYHRVGSLAEPDRDFSGYRRYSAKSAVELIRIKVLAESGVPPARVRELLEASPSEFATEVASIDDALKQQITEVEHRRRQLAGLLAGDRLVLPGNVADLLALLESIGVSDRGVSLEREGSVLLEAVAPELLTDWTREKTDALSDPAFRELYLAVGQAWDLDPDDPRVEALAARLADWTARRGDVAGEVAPESRPRSSRSVWSNSSWPPTAASFRPPGDA